MKYSDIVGVEPLFDSTFNMTEEKEDYWKQFISNEKFESNLKEIIGVFNSPNIDNHKSIWVQGTYGTGKSHSTSVIKHLLSDDLNEISDYIDNLADKQLKSLLKSFRNKSRVFPVVLKGTYSIVDTEDLKYTIQKEVVTQLENAGVTITVKSDFQAAIEMVEDERFSSFWDSLLKEELNKYARNREDIKHLLLEGDIEILKEINNALKASNMIKATPDIKQWLIEVSEELKKNSIADYMVIFWDEFTSLLEISERRSILNVIQDIAELSKAPAADPKQYVGVYVFLVTHKSMEATDSYKELKEDEKSMAKARFLSLKYDMHDITTYHILSNAIKIKNKKEYEKLVEEREVSQSEVAEALKEIVAPLEKPAQTKAIIKQLYPFHPYTAYLATFVSRAIGSAERSIFEFLNDENKGFKAFIENDINSHKYLTADYVWDFFAEAFSEDRTNSFDAIINKYSMYSMKLKDTDIPVLATFKVILLLNLLIRVTQMDGADQEKSLVRPSKKNILNVLSGEWSSTTIEKALEKIDNDEIVRKGPDDVYEIASSVISPEKVQAAKNKIYLEYEDVSKLFNDEYPAYKKALETVITSSEGYNRMTDFAFLWGGTQSAASLESKIVKSFKHPYAAKVAVFLFRGDTPDFDKRSKKAENSIATQKEMIKQLSAKDSMSNIVFVVSEVPLGQQRFEGIIDSKAKAKVARESKLEDPAPYENKEALWMEAWKKDILSGPATVYFRDQQVITPTYKTVANSGVIRDVKTVFYNGVEKLSQVSKASTSWKNVSAKKTVEKVCYAQSRGDIEKLTGPDAAISYLLKNEAGDWLFDENLNYIGSYDSTNPICVLIKAIDDKIADLRKEPAVDVGSEFIFLTKEPFGYYTNYICMGAVALAFRRYIGKMYLADQGSLVNETLMRDIINSAFKYWMDGKIDSKLRVRFSTAEEKELIDVIQKVFSVKGDGISETKWQLRTAFQEDYKSPLWTLKYAVDKGDEFNSVIDAMFSMANATNENITQDGISSLLEGLKKQKTTIALTLKKVHETTCLHAFFEKVLAEVNYQNADYDNLLDFLKQKLSDDIVFWQENDVENAILQWCVITRTPTPLPDEDKPDDNTVPFGGKDNPNNGNGLLPRTEDDDDEENDGDVPAFDPIKITPIAIGRTHSTIEAATALINEKTFDDESAKALLTQLCKEYPVVCSAIMRLISEG